LDDRETEVVEDHITYSADSIAMGIVEGLDSIGTGLTNLGIGLAIGMIACMVLYKVM
jgi:hypothetical protein